MDKLSPVDVRNIFIRLESVMEENKDYLISLDAAVGDGDLGITMSKGFRAAKKTIADLMMVEDIGELFLKAGMAIATAAPSTMGTLVGSGFMKAGKELKGKIEMGINEMAILFTQFTEGIILRGKAQPGEKTIIDAIHPVALTLQDAAIKNSTLDKAIIQAYDASVQGLENTKSMKPQHGKQVVHREKSFGLYDPGAMVGMLIIKTIKEYVVDKN